MKFYKVFLIGFLTFLILHLNFPRFAQFMSRFCFFIFCSTLSFQGFSQNLQTGIPILEENIRRAQVLGKIDYPISFLSRPIDFGIMQLETDSIFSKKFLKIGNEKEPLINSEDIKPKLVFLFLPILSTSGNNARNPYPEVSNLILGKGFQTYFSAGFYSSFGPLSIQIQPELIFAENKEYETGLLKSTNVEYLERFGSGSYSRLLPGQSSVRLNFGAFSLGASTENIWWGPGQFNSLLFSNNAFGFEHLTFNTRKPAETFLGSFEGQLLVGRLEGSDFAKDNPTIEINEWRYLNGFTFSYQPKWLPGLYVGTSRVFQQYNSLRGNSFSDYFPIFNGFQKERLIEGQVDSGLFDQEGRSQQITFFARYFNIKAKAELYFEYGRRDHAINWREAILNPEHARAYLFGFTKLVPIANDDHIQIRGEVLQQQESINIIVRYPGTSGSLNWSGHGIVRHGFSNLGQMLGPGIGPSSNIQTLEAAWIRGMKKLGIRFERLNRHQDMYVMYSGNSLLTDRWIDFSLRLLGDWQWNKLLMKSQLNFINSNNYLWQPAPNNSSDFPNGNNMFSMQGQVSIIYFLNK